MTGPPGGTATPGEDAERVIAGMAAALGEHMTRTRLLEVIVEAAAMVVGAAGSALLLIDEQSGDLWFEAALQAGGTDVRRFRVPLGHGVAGLVAVSGQPMAIAHAADDPRHASDIAEQIGYAPKNIVCVPLHSGDRVIGVLECLDKRGAESFQPHDIEVLGHFANVAAAAIAFGAVTERLAAPAGGDAPATASDAAAERSLALARRLHAVASRGEPERELVETVVAAIDAYVDAAEGGIGGQRGG